MGKKRKVSFEDWIDSNGVRELSELLGVHRMTVHQWRIGRSTPRPEIMMKIRKLTRGLITYEAMIDRPVSTRERYERRLRRVGA